MPNKRPVFFLCENTTCIKLEAMEEQQKEQNHSEFAFEFSPIVEGSVEQAAPTKTLTLAPNTPSSTSTKNKDLEEADSFIDRRGYTPTDTSEDPCIIKVDLYEYGKSINIKLITRGTYHAWWYIIDGGAPHLVIGVENVGISNLAVGSHTIEIYLTGAGHKRYTTECTKKTLNFSSYEESTQNYILENCIQKKMYLIVTHRQNIQEFAYIDIDHDEYTGCWIFTSLSESSVDTINTDPLDISSERVFTSDADLAEKACECCDAKDCAEQIIPPIIRTKPVRPPPYIPPTETVTRDYFLPPNITCSAELIVKKQTTETLRVKGNESDKSAYLNVRGCPKIKSREKYYVWIKRSDDCNEEWINENPFVFEWISKEECNCVPYLVPTTSNIETNLAKSPLPGEEIITSLKLNQTGSPVYIVHMLISTTNKGSQAGKEFYKRYINKDLEEYSVKITANNNTEKQMPTGNLYFSPSQKNPGYFDAFHAIDVGKTVSRINRIYLSEALK